ncbi:MAG: GTPase Era [Spirochaetes bacterium]|nr:GTPase Era [Spirochaetota bacterium]
MKSAFITLIGRPSSGKSTLVNKICGYKVSIVSATPQTTRNVIRGILTEERGQLIFQDTPGYHISEKKINNELKQVTETVVNDAEIILYVTDCTREPGEEEKKILEYLAALNAVVIVALNKIDLITVAEKNIPEFLESLGNFLKKNLRKKEPAKDISICHVSAMTGEGVDKLLDVMFEKAPEGEKLYPDDVYTDQDVAFRISEIIREKAVNRTKEEIPHSVYVEIADIEMNQGQHGEELWVRAFLIAESESQKKIIIGSGGEKIRAIKKAAKREIKSIFPYPVIIDLRVKVNSNWRKKRGILSRLIR